MFLHSIRFSHVGCYDARHVQVCLAGCLQVKKVSYWSCGPFWEQDRVLSFFRRSDLCDRSPLRH